MAISTPPLTPSAFVAKLNSAATAIIYCTYLSGSLEGDAYGIALDPLAMRMWLESLSLRISPSLMAPFRR